MLRIWKIVLFVLLLIAVTVWFAALYGENKRFRIIACDVGQGDSILAVYGNTQVLVDGGPNRKVVECLSRHLPFWDRQIEAVILTHPEKDHYEGLIDVYDNYKVNNFITSGLDSGNQSFQVLESSVGSGHTLVHRVVSGQKLRLGMIYLDIVHPSAEYLAKNSTQNYSANLNSSGNVLGAFSTSKSKNDFSLVAILSFGNFDALLTGDIEDEVSDVIAEELALSAKHEWEYIKIPHHGSKNGVSEKFIKAADAEMAIISSGKDNRYGHPHYEVLELLSKYDLKVLRTDLMGDVVVESDGKSYWLVE